MSYIYSMVDLWNEGGTTFKGIQINVTNTSSAAASRVMDLQVGGVSQFQVAPNGQQFGSLGTTLLPSISFIGDPNTGMWSPAADTIAWSTGGTERLRVDSSGNVGIGTTSSSYDLSVGDSGVERFGTDGGVIYWGQRVGTAGFQNAGRLSWDTGKIFFGPATSSTDIIFDTGPGTERLRITHGGIVGIGTSTPNGKLDVSGGAIVLSGTAGSAGDRRYISGGGTTDAFFFNTPAGGPGYYFAVGETPRFQIDASGNTTPGADNTQNFGSGSLRWATIYAGTGTINTSDERYKVLRKGGDLSDAEYRAWSNVRAIVYQDKDSFERKGSAARLHVGYSWQSIQAAFEAEGLDAGRYGLWCEDALEAPVEKTRTAQRQATEAVEQPYEEVRIVDGAPVMVRGTRTVDQPIFENIQVTDAATGEPVFLDGEPMMAPVPVMEDFEETFTEMEPTGETRGALRYNQCSVIEAAWLRRELASVVARLSALEAA